MTSSSSPLASLPLLFLLLACCSAQTQTTGTLGTAVSVSANTETEIIFGLSSATSATLTITSDTDTDVTVSVFASMTTSLTGYEGVTFTGSTNVGFTVDVAESSATLAKLELKTPPLSTSAAALLTSSVEAGCLQFDSSTETYSRIDVDDVSTTKEITVTLPSVGTYVFVAADVDAAIPVFFDREQETEADSEISLTYGGGLSLTVTTESDNSLTVSSKTSASNSGNIEGMVSMGKYFDFNLATEETVDATISFEYDSEVEAALNSAGSEASSLRFAFYSEAESKWVVPSSGGSVDTSAKVMTQTTTHFSEWGVYAGSSGAASVSVLVACAMALFNALYL